MSFNTLIVIGCVAFFIWAVIHSALLANETEQEREAAIAKEKANAERNRQMAKQAAVTGAKIAGKALLKLLKK